VPCNREGKVAEPILNMTFAPDAPLAAREVRVRRVGGGMPRNGMPCAVARSVCCSRRAAMNGAFISMQPLSADYTTVEAVQRRAVFRSVRYYALRHGHFSDPYSVRVALDGTAEPRYKDQGSGLCRAGWLALGCAWVEGVARPRVGGTGHTQRLQPDRMNRTAPNGTNAQRRDATPTEVGARRTSEPSRVAPARAPRGPAPGRRPRGDTISAIYRAFGKIENAGESSLVHGTRRPRAAAGCIPERSAVFALRLRCARCACGLYVLRTPLGPPSPVYSMPNIEHAMPAGAFVESCVSASARRSSVGG